MPEIVTEGAFGTFSISAPGRLGLDDLKAAWWAKILELKKAEERLLVREPTAP